MCDNPYTTTKGVVDKYQFRLCHRCLFVYCPKITANYMAELYAAGYKGQEEEQLPKDLSPASLLEPALNLLPEQVALNILDFGSGQSQLDSSLRQMGHSVVAADLDFVNYPDPLLFLESLIRQQAAPDNFDFVYSFQVFERLPEPRPVLDALIELTKPEGLILIYTDMETPERDQEGFESWEYVAPPEHCSFFRHKTFSVYLEDKPHTLVWKDEKRVVIR